MKLIKNIVSTKFSISQIKSMFDSDMIFIDNSFQRRYVWEEKHKIALIETILLGYDIPAIYLWQQEPDPTTGSIRYSVVDGQQRIGAIISFLKNEFPLTKKYLISTTDSEWNNKYFNDLSDDLKRNIWAYALNVNDINKDVTIEEIKTMFLRLNITNKALNYQELRNAQFNGKFIKLAIELSELDFWRNNLVFSNNDIRRMKDVEFISHLLIFLRKGMKVAVSQSLINKMYDLYNDEYTEYNNDKTTVINILNQIQIIINKLGQDNKSKINKITHIYTLFVAMYALNTEDNFNLDIETIENTICNFYLMYFNSDYSNPFVETYLRYSQDAVASLNSRLERYNSLMDFIKTENNID